MVLISPMELVIGQTICFEYNGRQRLGKVIENKPSHFKIELKNGSFRSFNPQKINGRIGIVR